LHIGSQIDQIGGSDIIEPDRIKCLAFLSRAGQALATGGYQQARRYSVEAVLLYAVCKYLQHEDPDADVWLIMGVAVRLAMRMGYHRDPCHLAHISPFEGEMRRRTFYVVEIFYLLFSFQAGLPAIIHEDETDTEPPSNLLDSDFDEDCKSLPPSRPSTDPTPVLYYYYKSRVAKVFRRVIRHTLSLKVTSYEETIQFDGELRGMREEIPPSLRMKPLASSFTDQPYMILHRLNLDLLYQKSLCVLHQNYLNHDRLDPKFAYSKKICTDSALQILKYQAELHVACQPGGQLGTEKLVPSSVVLHDSLLAAMVISLDLHKPYNKLGSITPEELKTRDEKYNALRSSYNILSSRKAFSRDARRDSNILAAMLSKVQKQNISSTVAFGVRNESNVAAVPAKTGVVDVRSTNADEDFFWTTTSSNESDQELPWDHFALSDINTTIH